MTMGVRTLIDKPVDITRKRDDWMEATLDWIGASLQDNPRVTGNPAVRREALLALDDVLHFVQAPHIAPVQRFFGQHMGRALEEIQRTSVAEGADIWKLYNHAFVVRTPSHTLCFGFFRGIHDMIVPLEQIEALSAVVDAHFISHEHGDHLDLEMVTWMLGAGRPVVMPPAVAEAWKEHGILSRVCHVREGAIRVGDLEVTVLPGHQTVGDSGWGGLCGPDAVWGGRGGTGGVLGAG